MSGEAQSRRLRLVSGEVATELSGAEDAPLVIGIPGLSANMRSFDAIYEGLDGERHRKLAFDPRGRGRSEKTAPGTYGWDAHARDVAEMADQLGAATFDLVGWSMGAWIAMKVAEMYPGRVRRIALIDACGWPEESAVVPIYAGLDRLGMLWPSREDFLNMIRSIGMYQPWTAWERLFDYEIEDVEGGARTRTEREAPWEDDQYRLRQDPYALWPAVTMPSVLLMALRPIPPNYGYILTREDYERFLREVPGSSGVEVDANHFNIGIHPDTTRAVRRLLEG